MLRAQQSYDRVAAEYTAHIADELAGKPLDRELLARFAAQVKATVEHPVCDLGCGPGHVGRYLHDLGVPIVGIDLSPGMLAQARTRNPDIEFFQGDMKALDVPDGRFSGVAAFYSILHFPRADVPQVLKEIKRVLIPGGLLLLTFHIGEEIRHVEEFFDEAVDLDFVFFLPDEMRGYLASAGFQEIEVIERDPYPEVEVQTRRAYIFAR